MKVKYRAVEDVTIKCSLYVIFRDIQRVLFVDTEFGNFCSLNIKICLPTCG